MSLSVCLSGLYGMILFSNQNLWNHSYRDMKHSILLLFLHFRFVSVLVWTPLGKAYSDILSENDWLLHKTKPESEINQDFSSMKLYRTAFLFLHSLQPVLLLQSKCKPTK